MNILPLVLTFMLVFTLCSSLLLEEKRSTFTQEKNYLSYMKAERDLKNKIEKKYFASVFSSAKKSMVPPKKEKQLKSLEYVSRRNASHPLPISRLNIYLLFEDSKSPGYSILYETTAKLLRNLYGHTRLFTESPFTDLEYQILDNLIECGKKNKNLSALTDFHFTQKNLAFTFYKMTKGTSYYSLSTKPEGYPPLEDFLYSDEKSKNKPLSFSFASTPILLSFLGNALTKEILATEEAKWGKDHKHHTVTKTELNKFLLEIDNPFKTNPDEPLALLSFSKAAPPSKELSQTEQATKIFIKKTI